MGPIAVIGAALDLGAGRRGVDMGPSAIRYAGLDERIRGLGRDCLDLGNVHTAVAEATPVGDERTRYLREILTGCERVADRVDPDVAPGVGTPCGAASPAARRIWRWIRSPSRG